MLRHRLFLASSAAAVVALCCQAATAQVFEPIKPPAPPLITRAPYLNTWLRASSGVAPGVWPTHWNGVIKALTGIAYIDGQSYVFAGAPAVSGLSRSMTQMELTTTPTQSIFTFNAGGVDLTVDFLSPVEATDLRRLSMPLADIITTARSSDGNNHTVSIYFDISGEWASGLTGANGQTAAQINWAPETIARTADGSATQGTLSTFTVTPAAPQVFTQDNDDADWGTVLWSTGTTSNLTTQSGQDTVVRGQFVGSGVLANSNDANQPRAINDAYPVFAFAQSLGTVGTTPTQPFTILLGKVRDPAINFLGNPVRSLWTQYWPAYENMLAFAYNDATDAVSRADATDTAITDAATKVGGADYAAVAALALRQAFAATELVNTTSDPYLFLEEISSDDNVQTVDVMYPSMPVFLYLNPELVRYLLAPVIFYAESGQWPQLFAPHDIGSTYPNATGHNDGGGENMPVEETANMLIMADAYMQRVSKEEAAAYATAHYAIFKQWGTYLTTVPTGVQYANALDPQFQNQTDDFTGPIAHSVNLALKGIEAVGAMGQIAAIAGNNQDANYFKKQSESMIATWVQLSQNATATHLLLQYREPANTYSPDTTSEPDNYYSLKYNAYPDKLLGLNLIPSSILAEEATYYKTQETIKGIPLDPRHTYTKADWELWTAAASNDATLAQDLMEGVYNYANTSTSATPFPDLYDTIVQSTTFSARPVVGGVFAPLTLTQAQPGQCGSGGPGPGGHGAPSSCPPSPSGHGGK